MDKAQLIKISEKRFRKIRKRLVDSGLAYAAKAGMSPDEFDDYIDAPLLVRLLEEGRMAIILKKPETGHIVAMCYPMRIEEVFNLPSRAIKTIKLAGLPKPNQPKGSSE